MSYDKHESQQMHTISIPIRISDGAVKQEVRSPIVAPPGMRIAGCDPLKENKKEGSITLSIRAHAGKKSEERTLFHENDLKAGFKASAVSHFSGEAKVDGHIGKKLHDLYKESYEQYTLELVAEVEPIKKSSWKFWKKQKVNLDAELVVHFEPIPEPVKVKQAKKEREDENRRRSIVEITMPQENVPANESVASQMSELHIKFAMPAAPASAPRPRPTPTPTPTPPAVLLPVVPAGASRTIARYGALASMAAIGGMASLAAAAAVCGDKGLQECVADVNPCRLM